MSQLPGRVRRAFAGHDSFERVAETRFRSTTAYFDAAVDAEPTEDRGIRFDVTVRVPVLSAVTEGHVADVVEDGWYETFERRVVDVGGVTRIDRDLNPEVHRDASEAVVELSLTDSNERRGVDDAGALIDFVEGTYVQGIIPGYEYTEPVASVLSKARRQGDGSAF